MRELHSARIAASHELRNYTLEFARLGGLEGLAIPIYVRNCLFGLHLRRLWCSNNRTNNRGLVAGTNLVKIKYRFILGVIQSSDGDDFAHFPGLRSCGCG